MNLFRIVFSPTGGTKRAADLVASAWGDCPARDVDLMDRGFDFASCAFGKDDLCILAVPSFGGRVPAAALDRLRQMQGGGARAVLVTAYGNRDFDDTLLELSDAAEAAGFAPVAGLAAVTEHSIMRQFGAGRPDAADCAEVTAFAKQIRAALDADALTAPALPGDRPFRAYGGVPFHPAADKTCTGCGACAKLCPVGAIAPDDPRKTDNDVCISCMGCISACPKGARKLSKVMLAGASLKMKSALSGRKENKLFLTRKEDK